MMKRLSLFLILSFLVSGSYGSAMQDDSKKLGPKLSLKVPSREEYKGLVTNILSNRRDIEAQGNLAVWYARYTCHKLKDADTAWEILRSIATNLKDGFSNAVLMELADKYYIKEATHLLSERLPQSSEGAAYYKTLWDIFRRSIDLQDNKIQAWMLEFHVVENKKDYIETSVVSMVPEFQRLAVNKKAEGLRNGVYGYAANHEAYERWIKECIQRPETAANQIERDFCIERYAAERIGSPSEVEELIETLYKQGGIVPLAAIRIVFG